MTKRTLISLVILIFAFSAIVESPLNAQGGPPTEYDVKAAFLFNFAKFIEWPPASSVGPFVVGILGEDPFGSKIDAVLAGKTVRDQSIRVERFADVRSLGPCQILFVSSSASAGLPEIQAALAQKGVSGVLTIGESPGFVQSGGVIRFYVEAGKVRFEISPKAGEKAGLKISSQLLKLAKIVG